MPDEGTPDENMPDESSPGAGTPPDSTSNGEAPKPAPVEPQAVLQALAAARKALAERDVDRAEEQIDLAIVSAGDIGPELAARIEQEQALAAAVRAFWEAVRQSMSQLEGTEELKIGNSIGIVVEVDGETIIIRESGRNQRYSIGRARNARPLPARLAQALAERWLKADDPAGRLLIGAFLGVDPQGDRSRALEYVQEAEQRGAESAALVLAALQGAGE
jgi:pyruvate/2-oxoglutarate dehydrogenase complex dihydrolipoamide acyltransferase (E2) component